MFGVPKRSSENGHQIYFCLAKDLCQLLQTSLQEWSTKQLEK